MVENLYGIPPSGERPAGLIERLSALPQGATVGIQSDYWRELVGICNELGLRAVNLDDEELLGRIAEKKAEAEALNRKRWLFQKRGWVSKLSPERMAMQIAGEEGKAFYTARYLEVFERERRIAQKIEETNPAVVIVGADSETDLSRELLLRHYHAFTQLRVIPGGKPDFIGTWNTLNPPAGLFEMYIEKRDGERIFGRIEDVLGSAGFLGRQPVGKLLFFKFYDPDRSQGKSLPLFYRELLCRDEGETIVGSYARGEVNSDGDFSPLENLGGHFLLYSGSQFRIETFMYDYL